jgi:hypothetical protein
VTAEGANGRQLWTSGALILLTLVTLSIGVLSARADMRVAAAGGAWGKAQQVPGLNGLNTSGNAVVSSVSCSSAGNCSAGGLYDDSSAAYQAFVVNEVKGVWKTAEEVPGTGSLNTGGSAAVVSVSCKSAGNCSAGGYYKNASGQQVFVVNEIKGVWKKAQEVPGTSSLNTGGNAVLDSVSCAAVGNCSASGSYKNASGHQAFVVNEIKGVWKNAQEVPGTSALNTNGDAGAYSVSCAAAGNCSAGGYYKSASGYQVFVVNEIKGVWKNAQEVPGTSSLNTNGNAEVFSVSCASTGNCSAGGYYKNSSGQQALVVNEVKGVWRKAQAAPGTSALNTDGYAGLYSVSCASPGNCSAGGGYKNASGQQAFVINEVNGVWKKAQAAPGTSSLNTEGNAEVYSLSCGSAGNCSAGGYYKKASGQQAFVVNEVKGVWKKAQEVPGTSSLNSEGNAGVYTISCTAAGNCSAGGGYKNASGHQALVVNEVKGVWKKAQEVSGTSALNTYGVASVDAVSCTSAGNCSAAGDYANAAGTQAFVVNEVKGTWRSAQEVPGTNSLNTEGNAEVYSVSCTSAGNCSAGGYYHSASGYQPFVVNEVKGVWRNAQEVPGTSSLNTDGNAEVYSVSCTSAGNCSAGGEYKNASGQQAFVVNEVKGTGRKAQEVPGTSSLNTNGNAAVYSVSCTSAGNCSAGGNYEDSAGQQAFVVNEVKGTWRKALEVPGTGALNTNENAEVNSVSCTSAGNCSAGGYFKNASGQQAFVVNEVKGTWRKALEVPGTSALNTNGQADVYPVSCTSAGTCSAGGYYKNASGQQAFVVNEVKGTWRKAQEVPGTSSLNTDGNAEVNSVSCTSAGNCSAGGEYKNASGQQAFVVNEVKGTWRKAQEVPGTSALNTNGEADVDVVSCTSAGTCSAGGYYQDSSGQQAFVVNYKPPRR